MKLLWLLLFLSGYLLVFPANPKGVQDSIVIDTLSKTEKIIIGKILLTGNKITKDRIIQRELLFKEGDTIADSDLDGILEQSRKNLVNTSLFNFVTVHADSVVYNLQKINVEFAFIERWYVWPIPIFELADRNFNAWLQKKDWSRLNYGLFLTWNNFRGRREKLIFYTRFGHDEKYELTYSVPYLNHKQTWGGGFSGGLSQNHEIVYNSVDNKEVYYKSEDERPRKVWYFYTEAYHRKGIHDLSWFKLSYNSLTVTDSVLFYNPDFTFNNKIRNDYLSFYFQYRLDYRDYKQYPLNGYYFDVELDKSGLGLPVSSKVNSLFLKSNIRKYFKLGGKLYYAAGLAGKVSLVKDQPYYFQRGLGYGRDFVRGYEYYVVDGQHYGVFKNNLKWELVSTRVMKFGFVPTEKFSKLYYAFYLNLFSDIGYDVDNLHASTNPLANQFLVGYGIGLDFVTYYDFVFRFEYSFNKMGESGFFIHFIPPI